MRKIFSTLLISLCGASSAIALSDSEVARLVEGLKSGQEAGLVEARQMLPFAGVKVLDDALDALASENEHIWRTARNIIADIANRASVPGYDDDQRLVSDALMARLAGTDDAKLQEQLMRLLPIPAHEKMDLAPVAALLTGEDAVMAEKARACLQEVGTTGAAETLADALPGASPEFQVAILDALSRLRDPNTVEAVATYLAAEQPAVRVAAARALAWTGSPAYLPNFDTLAAETTASTREDAWHATVLYANAMGMNGGNWATTLELFEKVFAESDSTALRGAAIAGMGTFGDERAVERIAEIVTSEGGADLEGPALEAFRSQDSTAGRAALAAAYPNLSPMLRSNVLRMLGDLGRDDAVQTFYAADPDPGNPVTRGAAVDAIAASGSPAALPLIAEYIGEIDGAEKLETLDLILHLAKVYEQGGLKSDAGNAFLLAYRNAANETTQATALEGVKRNPVPEATDIFLQGLESANLDDFPVSTLVALRDELNAKERSDDAKRVAEALTKKLSTTAAVQEVIHLANHEGTQDAWKGKLGFVRQWHLIGPLANVRADDAQWTDPPFAPGEVDLDATYAHGEEMRAWKAQETGDLGGMFNLMGLLGAMDEVRAFAYATLESDAEQKAVLRIGSDDGVRVWVNGEQVHANPADRGAALDQDLVPVTLKAGKNEVLLEIVQYLGGWTFLMRVTDPQGVPLNFE